MVVGKYYIMSTIRRLHVGGLRIMIIQTNQE